MSAEYVNDVPYVRHFIGDLSPTRLRLTAAVNGFTPPASDEIDYCELGCAHGDTLAALAAAYPEGRFLGVDIGATHIASAKKLAREGGLENIGFLERDFADLLNEDIGEFDYIVAHGVLSWISQEKRKALLAFAQAKLKPGGILYVSYNAMPGWGSVEPLRQLLLSPLVGEEGSSLDRARRGVELMRTMERLGAEYFTKNPGATEMLGLMERTGLPYVVHEYLHEHWVPMYFARVAWEMLSNDLHFVGVLPLHLNFRDTAIPESLDGVFAAMKDRVTFESMKDFAINEFFRRDLYVKGKVTRTTEATNTYFDTTAWGTLVSPMNSARTEVLPHRTVKLDGPVFDALFTAFEDGAATLPMLLIRPELARLGIEKVRAAILRLLIADRIVPMQTTTQFSTARAVDRDGAFTMPSVYNQMMLRRLSSDTPLVMTSVVAGTAFRISTLDALALRAFTETAVVAKRDAWIKDYVVRHVTRLTIGEIVVEDRNDLTRVVLEAVEKLRTQGLPKLVELGVLSPAIVNVKRESYEG